MIIFDSSLLNENTLLYASILGNIALGVGGVIKWYSERKTSGEINAHTQLITIFQELQKQLEKREIENKASEQENLNLEAKLDSAKTKIKQARLDLLDSVNYLRDLRRYAKLNKWEDESLIKTLDDFESQLTTIGSYLTLSAD